MRGVGIPAPPLLFCPTASPIRLTAFCAAQKDVYATTVCPIVCVCARDSSLPWDRRSCVLSDRIVGSTDVTLCAVRHAAAAGARRPIAGTAARDRTSQTWRTRRAAGDPAYARRLDRRRPRFAERHDGGPRRRRSGAARRRRQRPVGL